MNDRFEAAWKDFAESDRMTRAPADLEARVLAAAHQAPVTRSRRFGTVYVAMAAAASILIAVAFMRPTRSIESAVTPLPSRPIAITTFAEPIAAHVPVREQRVPARRANPIDADLIVYDELPIVLMIDAATSYREEPLQLVRLRVPREALLALGVTALGPEQAGMVDVDVLVGEDGLPKNIRQVRLAQEER